VLATFDEVYAAAVISLHYTWWPCRNIWDGGWGIGCTGCLVAASLCGFVHRGRW